MIQKIKQIELAAVHGKNVNVGAMYGTMSVCGFRASAYVRARAKNCPWIDFPASGPKQMKEHNNTIHFAACDSASEQKHKHSTYYRASHDANKQFA
jgi:hypothetical protein